MGRTPEQKSVMLLVLSFTHEFLINPAAVSLGESKKTFKNTVEKAVKITKSIQDKLHKLISDPIDPKVTDATRKAFSTVTSFDPAEQVYLVARGFWWAYWYDMKTSSVLPDEVKSEEEKLDSLLRFPKEKELYSLNDRPEYKKIESIFASIRPRKEPTKETEPEEVKPEESKKDKLKSKKLIEEIKPKELTAEQKSRVKKIQSIVMGWKVPERRNQLFTRLSDTKNIKIFGGLFNPKLWKDPKKLEEIFKNKKDPDKSMRELEEIIKNINAFPDKSIREVEEIFKKKTPGAPKSP
jgi:hypothetical protein